jgi:hypothetical protein
MGIMDMLERLVESLIIVEL